MTALHRHHLVDVDTVKFAGVNSVWLECDSKRSFYVNDPVVAAEYMLSKAINLDGRYIPNIALAQATDPIPQDVVDSYVDAYPHAFKDHQDALFSYFKEDLAMALSAVAGVELNYKRITKAALVERINETHRVVCILDWLLDS